MKVEVLIEEAFMASLNVTLTLLLIETPVASADGIVDRTVGATSDEAVVNVQDLVDASGVPATSCTPVVTVAV